MVRKRSVIVWSFMLVQFTYLSANAEPLTQPKAKALGRDSAVYFTVRWVDPNNAGNVCDEMTQGTGFIISTDGMILTAAHTFTQPQACLGGFDQIVAKGKVGYRYGNNEVELNVLPAQVVSADLVLMSFKETGEKYNPVKYCISRNIDDSSGFFAVGFPQDSDIVAIPSNFQNTGGPNGAWNFSGSFTYGMSGGPVFDADTGAVIGIINGGLKGVSAVSYVTPIARATTLLEWSGNTIESCTTQALCEERRAEVQQCIANRTAGEISRRFVSPTASVRCPGGGCLFKSSDCNKRETTARYQAPGGWIIDAYDYIKESGVNDVTGDIRVERNNEGDAVGLSAYIACIPPSFPGAAGGWNAGHFEGTERYLFKDELLEQARVLCEAQICAAD